MLLNDYQQIIEIDHTISDLHKKLAGLYKQRSSIFDEQTAGSTANDTMLSYDVLASDWKAFGIVIPAYATFEKKLAAAGSALLNLQQAEPEADFKLVLIPPSSIFNIASSLVAMQFSPALTSQTAKANAWKLFIVATNPEGMTIDDYPMFIKRGGSVVGGKLMTGLNTREYAVLLSMIDKPIDRDSWSVLVRDVDSVLGLVPCVMSISNSYKFDIDSTDVLLGDNHFRAALEIK